jgi:hypothetical protein
MDLFQPVTLFYDMSEAIERAIHFSNLRLAVLHVMHELSRNERETAFIQGREGHLDIADIATLYADLTPARGTAGARSAAHGVPA